MTLESATKIGELVPTNPPGTDNVSQGDDHFRVVKTAVQGTFPDVGSEQVINAGEGGSSPVETLGLPGNTMLWTPLAIADFVKANWGGWSLSSTTTNAYCRAHNDGLSGAQIKSPSGASRVPLNVHQLDGGGTYDTANARWTPGVLGVYSASAAYSCDPNGSDSAGGWRLEIRVNGTSVAMGSIYYSGHENVMGITLSDRIEITNVADYIELWTNHSVSVDGFMTGADKTFLSIHRVSDLIP